MSDEGSVWDRGPQYSDGWPQPAGDPVDTPEASAAAESSEPGDVATAAPPQSTPQAAATTAPSPRSRWALPRLPTSVWLLIIAMIVFGFVIVCGSHGSDPVLITQIAPEPTSSTTLPPTTRPPTTVVIIVPPTPSPSMLEELDRPPVSSTPSTQPATSAPPPTAPPTTGTEPPAPPSSAPPPTEAVTTTLAPTTTAPPTTVPPTTTTSAPAATAPPTGPVVNILGRVGPCRFGPNCLIVGFTVERFPVQPQQYVCEFADGSRYTFRFDSGGVEYACSTGDPRDSITIEVDGVRSQTFVHP